jgi:hypothetical protein
MKGKGKAIPIPVQAQIDPEGSGRLMCPGFSDKWHMKVANTHTYAYKFMFLHSG